MGEKIRILVAEKDRIYRDGLRLMIEKTVDFELVAEVDTVSDAINFGLKLAPDVIIMDNSCTHLPTTVAFEQLQCIIAKSQVLIFSNNNNPSDMLQCLEMGVSGYLHKGQDACQLIDAIRLIALGNLVIDKILATELKHTLSRTNSFQIQCFPQLTHRENQITSLMAQGLKNNAIAQRCNISEKTVRNHVSNILAKLELSNRQEVMKQYSISQ